MTSLSIRPARRLSEVPEAARSLPLPGWGGLAMLAGSVLLAWPLAGAAQAPSVSAAQASEEALSLPSFVQRVRQNNKNVVARRAEADLAATAVDRARGAFETQGAVSGSVGGTRQANTREEKQVRSFASIYDRDAVDLSATVSRLLSTGTKVEGKTTLSRFLTNLSNEHEYRSYVGVSVTHPLARDGGLEAVAARVRVAEADVAATKAGARDAESSVVAESVLAYWDLTLAQHRAAHALEKVSMGERLLAQAQALRRQGRIPESQVWDVENDLIRYRAAVSEAQVARAEAVSRVGRLMGGELTDQSPGWRAADALPDASRPPPAMDQAVARAFELRADLRQRQAALERERLQAEYAVNQAKPKVDVVASYGLNGGPGGSQVGNVGFLKDFPSWSVGLQMAMPLGGNVQGRADVQAAKLRLAEAQRQLEALRREIASDVATGVTLMSGAAQRWELWSEIARREERHVQLERQRLESGRSDVRELLFREERAINARMAVVEQQVAWSKAEALIEATQGLLLDRFR